MYLQHWLKTVVFAELLRLCSGAGLYIVLYYCLCYIIVLFISVYSYCLCLNINNTVLCFFLIGFYNIVNNQNYIPVCSATTSHRNPTIQKTLLVHLVKTLNKNVIIIINKNFMLLYLCKNHCM